MLSRTLRSLLVTTFLLSVHSAANAGTQGFKVCADPVNPPYSTRDGSGFENQIAELFAEQLGRRVEYTWFPQRMGFIRNTLKKRMHPTEEVYKCDIVMGLPKGYDRALTTDPYYRSTYVMIYAKGRGWDAVKSPEDLLKMDPEALKKLPIAMFDRGPGTAWIVKNGLVDQGVPYQAMTGDPNQNTAMTMAEDLSSGAIDMAILWGPMAGYVYSSAPGNFVMLPMQSAPGMRFNFPMSMGVRYSDKARRDELNELIADNSSKITELMIRQNIPLVDETGKLLVPLPQ